MPRRMLARKREKAQKAAENTHEEEFQQNLLQNYQQMKGDEMGETWSSQEREETCTAFGRCRRTWENIKTDPKETGYGNKVWMCLFRKIS
jgi:hypothetical protein